MASPQPPGAVRPGATRPGAPAPVSSPSSPPASAPAAVNPAAIIAAVKRPTFLNVIKSKKVVESKPSNQLLVVGNKGVKTISAVAVDIEDGTSVDGRTKIRATKGLPIPAGSRVLIITFDNQSGQSLKNYYGEQFPSISNVEIISMMDPVYEFEDGCIGTACDHESKVKSVVYPGWDGGVAASGTIVADAFKEILVANRDSVDVGLLVIDHYGKFVEEVAKYHAYNMAATPLDKKLEMDKWTPRNNKLNEIDHLVRTLPMPGGWVIATGSREQHEGEKVTVVDEKEGGKIGKVRKDVVASKWSGKIIHNWGTVVQVYKLVGPDGNYIREAEVQEGRHPLFPEGAQLDITGSHIGLFQRTDLLEFKEPKEPKLAVLPSSLPKQPLKPMSVS